MSDLTYTRQKAIDDLLRFMGCTDAKASNCEHMAAVTALADACYRTMFDELDEALLGSLRSLGFKPPTTELHFRPGVTGHREGKLR